MADERFDLSYRGLLAPGADPERARQRLAAIFKLSDKGAERLFTGKPVIVKRGADAATAAQFEKVFAHAGAVLTLTPVTGPAPDPDRDPDPDAEPDSAADSTEPPQLHAIDTARLALAPQSGPLEPPPLESPPTLDLDYLSLVPGDDWTLADCEPPPTPIPEPDIGYLTLEPAAPAAGRTDPRLD